MFRSREKRRINDLLLEQKVLQLLQENLQLKKDLLAVRVSPLFKLLTAGATNLSHSVS